MPAAPRTHTGRVDATGTGDDDAGDEATLLIQGRDRAQHVHRDMSACPGAFPRSPLHADEAAHLGRLTQIAGRGQQPLMGWWRP